jgi:uncharacterized protein involved in outer membrane biogenesis
VRARPIVLGILLLLALAAAGALFAIQRYVQSDAFKQAVLRAAQDALGSDVRINALRVSLFQGVSLEGLTVASPGGFGGDLLTAEALVVRYRLWPLLRRRLEIDQVTLTRPVLRLTRRESGEWSYQRPPAPPAPGAPPPPPPPAGAPPPRPAAEPSGLQVVVPRLAVADGEVVIAPDRGRPMARVERLELTSAATWQGGALRGNGTAHIGALHARDRLQIRQLTAPLELTPGKLALAPLSATVAGGALGGSLRLELTPAFRYLANLEVRDADVAQLLREAGTRAPPIKGKLRGRARLEGAGGLATLAGEGQLEVVGGALADLPIQRLLAALLQTPELASLPCDECRVEFALAGEALRTPVVRVVSRDARITGRGVVSLAAATLDHELTLAISPALLQRLPRDVRRAFAERPDGLRAVDFRVWGPYDAPRTDLSQKLLKGVTEKLLERGLKKLFR